MGSIGRMAKTQAALFCMCICVNGHYANQFKISSILSIYFSILSIIVLTYKQCKKKKVNVQFSAMCQRNDVFLK